MHRETLAIRRAVPVPIVVVQQGVGACARARTVPTSDTGRDASARRSMESGIGRVGRRVAGVHPSPLPKLSGRSAGVVRAPESRVLEQPTHLFQSCAAVQSRYTSAAKWQRCRPAPAADSAAFWLSPGAKRREVGCDHRGSHDAPAVHHQWRDGRNTRSGPAVPLLAGNQLRRGTAAIRPEKKAPSRARYLTGYRTLRARNPASQLAEYRMLLAESKRCMNGPSVKVWPPGMVVQVFPSLSGDTEYGRGMPLALSPVYEMLV